MFVIDNTELYNMLFFNDQYDELEISRSISTFKNYLYCEALSAQRSALSNIEYAGTMNNFFIDKKLNRLYGIATNAYSTFIPYAEFRINNEAPSDELCLFSSSEMYSSLANKAIDQHTTLSNLDGYFKKSIIISIYKYRFLDAKLVFVSGGFYIFIEQNISRGLSSDLLNTFISEQREFKVYTEQPSTYYYTYRNVYALINANNNILVSNIDTIHDIKDNTINNDYRAYITISTSNPCLLCETIATYIPELHAFSLPASAVSYIRANSSSCKVYLLNANKRYSSSFVVDTSLNSYTTLPLNNGKLANTYFDVYVYDTATNIYQERISYEKNIITLIYPTILNCNALITELSTEYNGKTIKIEIPYSDKIINRFDNNFAYAMRDTTQFIIDHINDELPHVITSYTPIFPQQLEFTHADIVQAINNNYIADVREFYLWFLIALLQDNYLRYRELISKINSRIRKHFNYIYSSTVNTLVWSNSTNRAIDGTQLLYPCTVLQFIHQKEKLPGVSVFIDGQLTKITYKCLYNNRVYVYIPVSLIVSKSYIDINVSVDPEDYNKSFILDDAHIKNLSDIPYEFTRDNTDAVAINDFDYLLSYNNGESFVRAIDVDQVVKVAIRCCEAVYDNGEVSFKELVLALSKDRLYDHFVDVNSNLFDTSDRDSFMVKDEYIFIPGPTSSYKKIPYQLLSLYTHNNILKQLGAQLKVITTNFYNITDVVCVNDTLTLNLTNKTFKRLMKRIKVYSNGLLIDPVLLTKNEDGEYDDYDYVSNSSLDPINETYSLRSDAFTNGNTYTVEYLSYDDDLIFDLGNSVPYDIRYGHTRVIEDSYIAMFTQTDYPIDKDMMKVYIDGRKIPSSFIEVHPVADAIRIRNFNGDYVYPNTCDSFVIYYASRDTDIYTYDNCKHRNCDIYNHIFDVAR